jgi:hypothetical protein
MYSSTLSLTSALALVIDQRHVPAILPPPPGERLSTHCIGGHAVAQWLRHCAANRKGSIPDGVTEIFHGHNPFGRTMSLGLTKPLTEMSTRNISYG